MAEPPAPEPPLGEASAPAQRDRERARAIVRENLDFVFRTLVRMGVPRATADDVTQQVFLVALGKLEEIRVGSERSYLFGIALRLARKARIAQMQAGRVEERAAPGDDGQVDESARPADELLDRKRARALLDEVLSAMPEDLRVVFVLFELEELPMIQIAEILSLPQGTVASRLRRARETFTEESRRLQARRGLPPSARSPR